MRLGDDGRIVAEEEDAAAKIVGSSGRRYDLVAVGAHGLGRLKKLHDSGQWNIPLSDRRPRGDLPLGALR